MGDRIFFNVMIGLCFVGVMTAVILLSLIHI